MRLALGLIVFSWAPSWALPYPPYMQCDVALEREVMRHVHAGRSRDVGLELSLDRTAAVLPYLIDVARRRLARPRVWTIRGRHPAVAAMIRLIHAQHDGRLQSRAWQLAFYSAWGRYGYLAAAAARSEGLLMDLAPLARSDFGHAFERKARVLRQYRLTPGFDAEDYDHRMRTGDIGLTSQLVAYGPSELPKAHAWVRRRKAEQDPLIQIATGSLIRATDAMGFDPQPLMKEFHGYLPGRLPAYLWGKPHGHNGCAYHPGPYLLSVFDSGALLPAHAKPNWTPPANWLSDQSASAPNR